MSQRVTRTQLGAYSIHNGGIPPQGGGGVKFDKFVANVKNANSFARDNKIITKGKAVTDALGATAYLDAKTGGLYSKGAEYGMSKGYGKKPKKKKRTTKKK